MKKSKNDKKYIYMIRKRLNEAPYLTYFQFN